MAILDFEALRQTPLEHDPYEFVVARGLIGARALEEVNRDYPAINRPANFKPEHLSYGPAFEQLLAELDSYEFQCLIENKFGVSLDTTSKTVTVRKHSELSDGNIHTDHWSKIITVILYFNREWTQGAGRLRLLRSADDIENYGVEVAPLGGSMVAFRRSAHSYHGYKRYEGERRMLQMSWVKSSKVAVYAQRLARFSTHTMKNLSRISRRRS